MYKPHLCIAILALAGAASLSLAQTPVTMKPYTTTAAQTPANLYAVDLNNDGITDILQDAGLSAPGFTVSLGNGDGTFKPPVHYSVPDANTTIGTSAMATADFNNDGKVDIAVLLQNTNKVAVYLGNGDGTLQSPKISTISLPSGWIFGSGGAAAADFNGDGKIDLVAWTYQPGSTEGTGPSALYVMEGDGTGSFSNPRLVFYGPQQEPDFGVFTGDFDADGKADIVADEYVLNNEGTNTDTQVHVCYGNSDFTFDCTIAYTASGDFILGSGDLNSDGVSDFYGLDGGFEPPQQLAVFYGQRNRTFNSYFQDLSSSYPAGAADDSSDRYTSQFVQADFNGDGRMDLVAVGSNSNYNTDYIEFFLAGSSPGQFTMQTVQMPVYYVEDSMPIVGLFGSGRVMPDMALNHSPNWGSPPQDKPSYLLAEVNQTNSGGYSPCTYPSKAEGFNVCSAGTPLNGESLFSASAASFGELRKMELWVDGKKVQEQWHAWDHHAYFNWTGSFSAGVHHATFYAADVDNRLQRYDFTFNAGGSSCSAPSSPGVNVCNPANNSTVSSPVQALASAAITGSLSRMELWVDGVKKYSETSSLTLSTSVPLAAGKHRFSFLAINTAGTKWESTVYATVP